MRMRIALLVLMLSSGVATADELPIAVAVNCPCWWPHAGSIGGSAYVGVTKEDAIRLNVASYSNHGDAIAGVFSDDGDDSIRSGRITDVGIGWTSYSGGLWSGFTYELGVLRRARNLRTEDMFAAPQVVATDTATYAGRIQLGWSWLFGKHVFVAAAIGLSMGWEHGSETTDDYADRPMPVPHHVSRADLSGEGYLRFGYAL